MSEALRQVVWKCDRCGEDAQAIFGIFPSCKFHTKLAAEDMALKMLTAYRDGAFEQYQAARAHAAPAQRQPLTQDEILDMAEGVSLQFHDLLEFARAIEAAHKITAAPAAQKGEKL